ncbi:hypothetical protein HYE53_04320 [Aggregatibacter actinomycetemcomitans]|uniref:hypothetical protein n=1 Tax=Aggregatibacter actinomycetemcomitans TaxID=714 RepID=UPI00197BF82B|nr:hypothetical protein [Aggregatibacter actinomycetemcomitans]MBN6070330.1 hypothetical protein [Aggregatibacter actinomycetemcomitans]
MMEQTRISLTEFWAMINEIKGRITVLEQQRNFNPDEIWTAKEVADYARVSYGYLMQKLIHEPDFPQSVGTAKKNAPKKYRAGEIIRYFETRNKATKTG